jgi:hypothetical protein
VFLEEEVEFLRRRAVQAGLWRFYDQDVASKAEEGELAR